MVVTLFLSEHLKNLDHYKFKKEESFLKAQSQFAVTGSFILQLLTTCKGTFDVKEKFFELLKMNLWGNKCDLSFSNGVLNFNVSEEMSALASLDPFILINDSANIWEALSNKSTGSNVVGILYCFNALLHNY